MKPTSCTAFGAFAVLAIVQSAMAGCAEPDGEASEPSALEAANQGSEIPRKRATDVPAAFSERVEANMDVRACPNPRFGAAVNKTHLQSFLPAGFRVANASHMMNAFRPMGIHPADVPAMDSGLGLVLYDASPCASWGLRGLPPPYANLTYEPMGWAVVVILVEPPALAERIGVRQRADFNAYAVSTRWNHPAMTQLYARLGFVEPNTAIATRYGTAGEPPLGASSITDASGLVASFSYAFTPATGIKNLDHVPVRFWQSGPLGTIMVDMIQNDETLLGPITSCQHRAGSWHQRVTGFLDCGDLGVAPPVFMALGYGTDAWGTWNWFPGVTTEGFKPPSSAAPALSGIDGGGVTWAFSGSHRSMHAR